MKKDFGVVLLLDTYAGLLTENQRNLCDMYYNQDYSLAEIATLENITRQAARDGIAKAHARLRGYERCLGLSERRRKTLEALDLAKGRPCTPEMGRLIDDISGIWRDTHGI